MTLMRHFIQLIETASQSIMEAVYLTPDQVPPQLRAGYAGKKFRAEVTERVTIPMDAGLWSGGSRDTYRLVRLEDGQEIPASDDMSGPWNRRERVIDLQPGFVVVKHTMSRGNDMGLVFFVHPRDAAALLPAPGGELGETEMKVLNVIGAYKASYRAEWARRMGISPADYEAAKQTLFQQGLIDKRGAITIAGRNARKR